MALRLVSAKEKEESSESGVKPSGGKPSTGSTTTTTTCAVAQSNEQSTVSKAANCLMKAVRILQMREISSLQIRVFLVQNSAMVAIVRLRQVRMKVADFRRRQQWRRHFVWAKCGGRFGLCGRS